MTKAKRPSFVCELPLAATPADERRLLVRLDCARQVYSACLGASLGRLAQLRESPAYKNACRMPRGANKSEAARQRAEAFRQANERVGFREYDLHAYATQFSHSWLGEHLDSNTVQKIATRAFQAAQQYAFGKRGRPRFKGQDSFDSVEGKTNASAIHWRENAVRWLGLELPALIDPGDPVMAHGVASSVKYVQIVRRKLNGRNRFDAQLICAGQPYSKARHVLGQGIVGLDLGLSNIAIVSDESATTGPRIRTGVEPFCSELEPQQKQICKLQRKLDRQRRSGNPDNYQPNGTVKPGPKQWSHSRHYVYTRAQLAELHRQQAAHRKGLHNRMVNRILALGDVIKLEQLSYRAFQKAYSRSVGFRGPGTFVARLRCKAESAGAQVDEFSTRSMRLSQTCLCGAVAKKPLSLRWHECGCGVGPSSAISFPPGWRAMW